MRKKIATTITQFLNECFLLKENNIVICKKERYNDNTGAYDIIYTYDTETNKINARTYLSYEKTDNENVDYDFVEKNTDNLKKIAIDDCISKHGNKLTSVFYWGVGKFDNIPVIVKGSRKYKEKTAKLVGIYENYNNFKHKTELVAKILGNDGNTYYISPNTLTVDIDTIHKLLSKLDLDSLLSFGSSNRTGLFYFLNV